MISVSLIEDNDSYRKLLVKIINGSGNFLLKGVYTSAEEAVKLIVSDVPDIAIVDIKLKTMSGIEFIEVIRNKLPQTQFLICTSYENDENVFNALRSGASGYILKNSTGQELINAIIELHNGGSPMSPYIARMVISLLHKRENSNNYGLTERELDVISLLSMGNLYKEISEMLQISVNTVKNHCKNIYKKLHVQNKTEAINKYRTTKSEE